MCNASNSANIDTMAPLFHNLATRVFPAGNADKTYGHVNDVYVFDVFEDGGIHWSAPFDI